MISSFLVKENSMAPSFQERDIVLVNRMSYLFSGPQVGHVVVARHPVKKGMMLLKRIVKAENDRYWLEGDNTFESSDSRQFGWVERGLIEGKVIHKTSSLDAGIMA